MKTMRKAQGALEYLIIIAAVLAIAAIVVLFISGAFGGATGGGDIAKCKVAASTCSNNLISGVYAGKASCQTPCISACATAAGLDVMDGTAVSSTNCLATGSGIGNRACNLCVNGSTASITK